MPDKYTTGHRPKESLEQLISRLNAGALLTEPTVPQRTAKRGEHAAVRSARQLSGLQLRVLLELLEGVRALCAGFAVKRVAGGWSVVGLHDGAEEHTVTDVPEWACSCPQNRLNGRVCKHLLALRGVT